MRIAYVTTAALVCGFLSASVSAWFESRAAVPHPREEVPRIPELHERWNAGWAASLGEAKKLSDASGKPILAYARTDAPEQITFETAAAADAPLRAALSRFVPFAVNVRGDDQEQALASRLSLHAAPMFAVLLRSRTGTPQPIDAAIPLTGALLEPFGLTVELERLSAAHGGEKERLGPLPATTQPEDSNPVLARTDQLDALARFDESAAVFAEALASERMPNGTLHRFALLQDAIAAHGQAATAEGPGPIEEHLAVEADDEVLYRGWSLIASSLDARRTSSALPEERWLRRLREATRLGYKHCPERALVPYAQLLLQRYALDLEDLDSLDRMFCRAVIRTLRKRVPDAPRLPALAAPFEKK